VSTRALVNPGVTLGEYEAQRAGGWREIDREVADDGRPMRCWELRRQVRPWSGLDLLLLAREDGSWNVITEHAEAKGLADGAAEAKATAARVAAALDADVSPACLGCGNPPTATTADGALLCRSCYDAIAVFGEPVLWEVPA